MDVVGQILEAKSLLSLEPATTTTMTDENGTTTTTIFNVPTIDGASLLDAFPSGAPHGLVIATGPDGAGNVYINSSHFVFTSTPVSEPSRVDDVAKVDPNITSYSVGHDANRPTATQPNIEIVNMPAGKPTQTVEIAKKMAEVLPPVGKGPYRCTLCVKVFPRWAQLQRHLKTHADDKKFPCNDCDASFNIQSNLVLHKVTHNPECSVCPECGKRFSRTASLRAHIMVHEKEENLFCTECGDEFTTQSKLDKHVKRHCEESAPAPSNYGCKQCSQVFTKASAFRDHMKTHYRIKASLSRRRCKRNVDRSTFAHKCSNCDKTFQKPSQLSRHMRIHTGERPFKCVQCEKSFNQKGALLIHLKKHSGEKPHKCEFCPAAFSQKGNLRAHIRRVHAIAIKDLGSSGSVRNVIVVDGQTTLYRCERCACAFRKLGSLNAHMSRMHSSEGGESSPNNGKTVNDVIKQIIQLSAQAESADANNESPRKQSSHSPDDILQQALQNSGLSGVQSGQSGASGLSKLRETASGGSNADQCTSSIVSYADSATGTLKRHVVKRVGGVRVHQCIYCVKMFKKPSDLVRHIRIHTREKPFKCSQCFRSFTVKSTLTAHIRAHTGIKDFGCEVCDKMFATQGSLRVHIRLHTGAKPFSCPHCQKTFRTSGHRKSHLLTHRLTSGNDNGKGRKMRMTRRVTLPEEDGRARQSNSQPAAPTPRPVIKRSTRRAPPSLTTTTTNNAQPASSMSTAGNTTDVQLLEPILITETGFVQVAPRGQRAFGELFAEPPASYRPYRCGFCNQGFKKSSHLKQHVRSHTGEKPYKCQLCYRGFVSSGVLKAHLRTHTGVKSHQCHVCDSAFTTKGSLKRHMSTHSEIRPFMCPYCQKTFKTTVNCKKHMKTHKQEINAQAAAQRAAEAAGGGEILSDVIVQVTEEEQKQQQQLEQQMNQVDQQDLQQVDSVVELTSQDQEMTLSETLSHLQQSLNQLNQQLDVQHDVQLVESDLVSDGGGGEEEVKTMHVQTFDQHAFEQFTAGVPFTLHADTSQCTLDISGLDPEVALSGHELLVDHRVVGGHDEDDNGNGGDVVNLGVVDLGVVCLSSGGAADDDEQGNESNEDDPPVLSRQDYIKDDVDVDGLEEHRPDCAQEMVVDDSEEMEDDDEINEDRLKWIHKCKECGKAFKRSSHLKQHASVHTGERPFKCGKCSNMFVSASALKGHLRTHLSSRDFMCEVCRAVFTTNSSLRRHMNGHSSDNHPYQCVHCNEAFRTQVLFKRHLRLHTIEIDRRAMATKRKMEESTIEESTMEADDPAPNVIVTVLPVSKKRPVEKSSETILESLPSKKRNVRLPVLQFSDETPCDFASAADAERDRLSKSKATTTTTTVPNENSSGESDTITAAAAADAPATPKHVNQCPQCPKSFKKPSDLVRHIRIHSGERPYKCEQCHKTFTVKSTLDSHVKTHSGKKHCFCQVCNSLFATKGSLKVHMRLHTGSKPFKCTVCEQKFRTSGHRKSHLMMHMKAASAAMSTQKKKAKSSQSNRALSRSLLKKTDNNDDRERTTTNDLMPPPPAPPKTTQQQQQQHAHPARPSSRPSSQQQLETIEDSVPITMIETSNLDSVTCGGSEDVDSEEGRNLLTFSGLDGGGGSNGIFQLESLNTMQGDVMSNITVSLEGLTADQLISADGTMHLQGLQTIQIDASILQQLQQQGNVNITLDASLLSQGLTLECPTSSISSTISPPSASSPSSNIVLQPMTCITLPPMTNNNNNANVDHHHHDASSASGTEVSLSINEAGEMVTTVSKVLPDHETHHLLQEVPPLGPIPGVQLDNIACIPASTLASAVPASGTSKKQKTQKFACDVCAKQFTRFALLKQHLQKAHITTTGAVTSSPTSLLSTPPLSRCCQVCSKVFAKPSQLYRHLRIHTGERPFTCNICARAFNQKNALTIHMKKHTGEKSHVCFFCGQLFAQKGNLRVHVRRVHSKSMELAGDNGGEASAKAAPGGTQPIVGGPSAGPSCAAATEMVNDHPSRDSLDLQLANFLTQLPSAYVAPQLIAGLP